MITLNLLQFIEDNGLGIIDKSLFWEKMPYDVNGIFIKSLGNATTRGALKLQSFELYSRGKNDVQALKQLNDVLTLLDSSFNVCKLPAVKDCNDSLLADEVNGVSIMPTSSITNYGTDDNGRVIYSAQGSIYYN